MKIKIKQVVLTAALSLLACLQAPVTSYALPFTRSGNLRSNKYFALLVQKTPQSLAEVFKKLLFIS